MTQTHTQTQKQKQTHTHTHTHTNLPFPRQTHTCILAGHQNLTLTLDTEVTPVDPNLFCEQVLLGTCARTTWMSVPVRRVRTAPAAAMGPTAIPASALKVTRRERQNGKQNVFLFEEVELLTLIPLKK